MKRCCKLCIEMSPKRGRIPKLSIFLKSGAVKEKYQNLYYLPSDIVVLELPDSRTLKQPKKRKQYDQFLGDYAKLNGRSYRKEEDYSQEKQAIFCAIKTSRDIKICSRTRNRLEFCFIDVFKASDKKSGLSKCSEDDESSITFFKNEHLPIVENFSLPNGVVQHGCLSPELDLTFKSANEERKSMPEFSEDNYSSSTFFKNEHLPIAGPASFEENCSLPNSDVQHGFLSPELDPISESINEELDRIFGLLNAEEYSVAQELYSSPAAVGKSEKAVEEKACEAAVFFGFQESIQMFADPSDLRHGDLMNDPDFNDKRLPYRNSAHLCSDVSLNSDFKVIFFSP
ncbi:uncharacterized protein LOC129225288 isoform X1 [Uloborus diversus]|uniref:uncharacterized protein LOC129225288 isoform X1 n=1 Tax=Uloborus diversus TaxID=327109 RepID=UPI00240A9A7B|nr:uncharacterized protein LOC129225288 isoform X1 [Uloborus diversus]